MTINSDIITSYRNGLTVSGICNKYWVPIRQVADCLKEIGIVIDVPAIKKKRQGTISAWSPNGRSVIIIDAPLISGTRLKCSYSKIGRPRKSDYEGNDG